MDNFQAFAISAAGMTLERTRVDVAALNLANANTVQTADGVGFQPMRVVARVGGETTPGSTPLFAQQVERGLAGLTLPQASIEPAGGLPRQVYEPTNPFADGKGFVRYPGVDTAAEMVTLMGALRAYEANVAAMNTSRTMLLKALDIGGGA
jgi:flagellar basal-body rod protein FlgC